MVSFMIDRLDAQFRSTGFYLKSRETPMYSEPVYEDFRKNPSSYEKQDLPLSTGGVL